MRKEGGREGGSHFQPLISHLQPSVSLPGGVFGSEVKIEGEMSKVLPVTGIEYAVQTLHLHYHSTDEYM